MALTTGGHPDEVVANVADVQDVPSTAIAEAKLRHEQADSDLATPQEKKQAAVEQAHALSTRPDGSYAQLHETDEPTLAVVDDAELARLKRDQEQAEARLRGEDDDSRESARAAATQRPTRATDSARTAEPNRAEPTTKESKSK